MGTFDYARPKLSSSAKPSGLTTNQFGSRRELTPQASDSTPQQEASMPIQLQVESDENGAPAWWSRLSFDPPARYGMQTPVQTKLAIGQPNDQYEQEADRVAAQVVNQISAPSPSPIQREDNLEEEDLQMKHQPGSIAPLVQRMDNLEEEDLQMKHQPGSIAPTLQRMDNLEEEDLQMMPVQRVAEVGETDASPDLESSIAQAKGGGQPLDQSIRAPIEQAMGADFSGVKIHTDAQADQLNRSVQARAFTTGQDVFFRQGEYNPGSRGGQELIAHELTHVVQQNGERVSSKPSLQYQLSQHSFAESESASAFLQQNSLVQGVLIQRVIAQGSQSPTYDDAVQKQRDKFKQNYMNFGKKFNLNLDPTDADVILDELLKGLNTGSSYLASMPKVNDQQRKDHGRVAVASETDREQSVREEDVMATSEARGGSDVYTNDQRPKRDEAFAKAQQSLDVFAAHAGANLTNAIFQKVDQAGNKKVPLCFWSGVGAMDAAKTDNPDGIVLESTIGSWFDDIQLDTLTGSSLFRIDLWSTLSEIYAKKAAEYHKHLDLKGYVGIGADMTQNIFNQIESPTVTQIATAKFQIPAPTITWNVVKSTLGADKKWKPEEEPKKGIFKVNSREAAVKQVKEASEKGAF